MGLSPRVGWGIRGGVLGTPGRAQLPRLLTPGERGPRPRESTSEPAEGLPPTGKTPGLDQLPRPLQAPVPRWRTEVGGEAV